MNVLILAPHPDDETLGAGGALLRHRAAGDNLYWLIFTHAWEPKWSREVYYQKEAEAKAVRHEFGFEYFDWLPYDTTRLEQIPSSELIDDIKMAIEQWHPGIVYIPHHDDYMPDHRAVYSAADYVLRPLGMAQFGVKRVLAYETPSTRTFAPNVYIDITEHINRKTGIMWLYETERQANPLPRSTYGIRAKAASRGAEIGVEFAEAFMMMREVDTKN